MNMSIVVMNLCDLFDTIYIYRYFIKKLLTKMFSHVIFMQDHYPFNCALFLKDLEVSKLLR